MTIYSREVIREVELAGDTSESIYTGEDSQSKSDRGESTTETRD